MSSSQTILATGDAAASARIHAVGSALDAQLAELADRMMRRTPAEGLNRTPIAGMAMLRFNAPSKPLPTVYEPCLCVVVQGRKQALLGSERYVYDALNYLVVSMSLPVIGNVIEATPERPYLCLRIDIDRHQVNELLSQIPLAATSRAARADVRALFVASTSPSLLDAVLRLVRLLDTPDEAAVLAPLALREIHYRVLTGELGQQLCELCALEGMAHRVAGTIALIKSRFAEPLRIEELAAAAHMSPSALHHRFKAVTAMSPLQFQKQLRLQEARRLMLTEACDAAVAAHRVGYESASQFSREYRRLFGAPPRAETQAQPLFAQTRG